MSQNLEAVMSSHPEQAKPRTLQFSYIARNTFWLLSLIVAILGWSVALASQAIVTADVGNGTVGVLWFAIVIQLFLIVRVLSSLATSTTYRHRHQIANFSVMAVVFATIGIDKNIFLPLKSQKALSAGWILVVAVDVLWILYFSSEADSTFPRLVDSLGSDPRPPPPPRARSSVANADSISMKGYNVNYAPSSRAASGVPATDTKPLSLIRESVGGASVDQRTKSMAGASTAATTASQGTGQLPGVIPAAPLSATRPNSEANASDRGTLILRAEALYTYTASDDPNEISFKKGDILEITDASGKWWEAIKNDGTKGIAPSNYLRTL